MKKIWLPAFLGLGLPFTSLAQTTDTTQSATYLYDHFINGSVLMKSGSTENALLNYDTENQSIVFKQGRQNMVLTGLENVDTVYVEGKKFIPVENSFYQVGTSTPIVLLISYSNKPHSATVTTDHNGTAAQNSNLVSNTVSDVYLTRRFSNHYDIAIVQHYWLRRGHSLYKANNERQIARVFPRKAEAIDGYIQANNINFQKEEDVARLVQFCNVN